MAQRNTNAQSTDYECWWYAILTEAKLATGLTRILVTIRRMDSRPDDIPFTTIGRMPSRQRPRECVVVSLRLSRKNMPVTLTSNGIQ